MNVYVDDELIFSLSDDQKKVLEYGIVSSQLDSDIKRRLKWIILDQHFGRRYQDLRAEWEPKLIAKGATSLPTDPIAFCQLAWQDPDYKSASQKAAERQNLLQSGNPQADGLSNI